MITLGLNAAFHDSAAALVIDGTPVAAAEEERFTRIKHAKRPVPFSTWELPYHAIDSCLRQADLTLAQVDHVAYSFDPGEFLGERAGTAALWLPLEPAAHAVAGWDSPWDPLFAAYVINAPRQLVDGAPQHLRPRLGGSLDKARGPSYRWHFVKHHLCHQASAFLAAPFARCAVMTLDGRGERATTTYGVYRDDRYVALGEVVMPDSLGLLYERITAHLGFLHSSDEYKVMALAALGTPSFAGALREHVRVHDDGQYRILPFDLQVLFGPPRRPGAPLTQRDLNLAASLQNVLEQTVLQLAVWLRETSGESSLAMAGGVALNCVMNSRLRDAGVFDAVWVQPAAGDAGTALGAALWTDARERRDPALVEAPALAAARVTKAGAARVAPDIVHTLAPRHWQMDHAYLGPDYPDDEIEALLRWAQLPYRRLADVPGEVAQLLAQDRIIGWFQGHMEFGPRALGARSILASPIAPTMQARLNELKDREDFRPVAPALPEEALAEWFTPAAANGARSPFMLFVYDTRPEKAALIPSACHADLSARVQTVDKRSNPRFHALLEAFGRIAGVPVLINTSFNVRGQPIVGTPRAALEAFYTTPLDALVIGSYLVTKNQTKEDMR
ncbi:MAG TPA: carbamoyltransferase C-terminal domain-containing protein [Burkholderiaceae bacterium]